MDRTRIQQILEPFVDGPELTAGLLDRLQLYLDLLLRWNARINLTAVRDPEQIITRHFGESLFVARLLLPRGHDESALSLADVGSGAGFPGLPMKLWAPQLGVTLIESQNRKATFLREAVRALQLDNTQVFCGRAEQWGQAADIVTLRAVEQFESALPIAAGLVREGGDLCLFIGSSQLPSARKLIGQTWIWNEPRLIPLSRERLVLVARRNFGSPEHA